MRNKLNPQKMLGLSLLVVVVLLAGACVAGQPLVSVATPETPAEATPAIAGDNSAVLVLYVGPNEVPCSGVGPRTCLQVKETPDGAYSLFYDKIEGFTFEPGYDYVLSVQREDVPNPPADASAYRYTLLEMTSKTPVENAALQGATWQLTSYWLNGAPRPSQGEATLTFQNSEASGNSGCNQFFAPYALDGDALTFGVAGSTMMACDEALMAQEQAVLANLEQVASYQIIGNQLQLLDAAGQAVLSFDLLAATPLVGANWQATGYNNGQDGVTSLLDGSQITIAFSEDGTLSGSAGCNRYAGAYTLEGDQLTFGPLMVTEMACLSPDGVMEQEAAFLKALSATAIYTIQGDKLELRAADDALVASFTATPEQAQTGDSRRPSANPVLDATWEWLGSVYNNDTNTVVDDPARYTMTLLADGKVALQVDCNRGGGGYTLDGSSLTLDVAVMTRVACPEGSLSDVFVRDLNGAATFVMDGSDLVINLMADAGNMRFQPGPVAVSAVATATLSPDQLSIDASGVAASATWQIVPATPYSNSVPLLTGAPEHLALTFDGDTLDEATFAGRAFYIVPLADYAAVWNDAGNPFITLHTDELKALLAAQPAQPDIQTGLLLPSPLASDVVAQPVYLKLAGLDATVLRWVGRLPQDLMPLVNSDLRYLVEGLSNDGRYFITGSFPITTATLPDSLDTLSEDEKAAFDQDPQGVMEAATNALSFLSAADFTPSLDALDAMLQSITVSSGITVSGVVTPTETLPLGGAETVTATETAPLASATLSAQGTLAELNTQTWSWMDTTAADGSVQTVPTPNRYQISFYSSGVVRILADCNRGGGMHRINGEAISITAQSMTRAACRKDSLSQQYLDSLGQAASWAAQDSDLLLTLQDGSVMRFTAAR